MTTSLDWRPIYDFWFPSGLAGSDAHRRMITWWFDGGSNVAVRSHTPLLEAARAGRLDGWRATPRGCLSLILTLDQLPRGLHAGTAGAYRSDLAALRIAEEEIAIGHYDRLEHPWEKMFFLMPLVHAEGPHHVERLSRVVAMTAAILDEAPDHLSWFYRFSAGQARRHLEVITRFGRFPHRNPILKRCSTTAEQAYIDRGDFVHRRRPDGWPPEPVAPAAVRIG